MSKSYYIGIDIGGTKILTALADNKGKIVNKVKTATQADKGQKVIISNILNSIEDVKKSSSVKKSDIRKIGVAAPGPLDFENGLIIKNSNLAWSKVPIVDILESHTKKTVVLENDANAAALAEKYFGAGRDSDNILYITISTGIGGGIIIDGQIFHGGKGNAGEIGHMTLIPDSDYQCGCGNYGCFEAVASGTAIARRGKNVVKQKRKSLIIDYSKGKPELVDARLVAEAAREGDQEALQIYSLTGRLLGIGIANMVNLFDPEIIVLGGGVMNAEKLFIEDLKESLQQRALNYNLKNLELKKAELGKNAGVVGAIAVSMGDDLYRLT